MTNLSRLFVLFMLGAVAMYAYLELARLVVLWGLRHGFAPWFVLELVWITLGAAIFVYLWLSRARQIIHHKSREGRL